MLTLLALTVLRPASTTDTTSGASSNSIMIVVWDGHGISVGSFAGIVVLEAQIQWVSHSASVPFPTS